MNLSITKVANGYILICTLEDNSSITEVYGNYAALEEKVRSLLVSPPIL